jgi:polyhydroxyalkanoate synthesis regulator phasin
MAQESGGTQPSALLETVPGIASVLRSPVADALVNMIKAGAGLGDFRVEDTRELITYAVRRGLIGSEEGERLTADLEEAARHGRGKTAVKVPPKAHRPARPVSKAAHKPAKRAAVKKPKAGKKRRA